MLSIRRLTPSTTASQMICPMNGRISRRVRELVMMRVSTPLE
jgi:hypothetical protein